MDADFFRAWITAIAAVVQEQRDHLTQLDAAIGDADHGTNLARGFTAVRQVLAEQALAEQAPTPTPGSVPSTSPTNRSAQPTGTPVISSATRPCWWRISAAVPATFP